MWTLDMMLPNINLTLGSDGAGGADSVGQAFGSFGLGFGTGFEVDALGSGSKSSFAYNGSGSFAWFGFGVRTGSG